MLKSAVILLTLTLLLALLSVSAGPIPVLSLNKRQVIPPQDDAPMMNEGVVETLPGEEEESFEPQQDEEDEDWGLQEDDVDPDMQDVPLESMPPGDGDESSDEIAQPEVPADVDSDVTGEPTVETDPRNPDTPVTAEEPAAPTAGEDPAPAGQEAPVATEEEPVSSTEQGTATNDEEAAAADGGSTEDGSSSPDVEFIDVTDSFNATEPGNGAEGSTEAPEVDDSSPIPSVEEEIAMPTPTPDNAEDASAVTEEILPTSTEAPTEEGSPTEQEDEPTTTSIDSEEPAAIPYPGPIETGSPEENPTTNVQSLVDDGVVPVVIAANTESQGSTVKPPTEVEERSSNAGAVVLGLMGVLAVVGLVSFLFVSKTGRRARTWVKQRLPEAGYRRTTDLEMTTWN